MKKHFAMRFDEKLMKKLDKICKKDGLNRTELITRLIENKVNKNKKSYWVSTFLVENGNRHTCVTSDSCDEYFDYKGTYEWIKNSLKYENPILLSANEVNKKSFEEMDNNE